MKRSTFFDAIAFDMDGTLIDSAPLFKFAAVEAASVLGYRISEEIFFRWLSLPPKNIEAAVVSDLGKDFPFDAYRNEMIRIWEHKTENEGIPPKPGIPLLIEKLHANHVPLVVATATRRQQAIRSLELSGLSNLTKNLVGGDEVNNSKPEPDIFLRAASILGVPARRCIAVEDSAVGIRAASDADMLTILVPDLSMPDPKTVETADYVLSSTEKASRVLLRFFGIE